MKFQNGFVSIISAALIMILMTLITVGFSRVMAREQRQALDRQLSTQAFYAAETGINDVRAKLEAGEAVNPKTDCEVGPEYNNGQISKPGQTTTGITSSDGLDVRYTCLLINTTPSNQEFSTSPQESKFLNLETAGNQPFSSLTFEWSGAEATIDSLFDCSPNPPPNTTARPSAPGIFNIPENWGTRHPILRVDLVNVQGGLSRNALSTNTLNYYFMPCIDEGFSGGIVFNTANPKGWYVNGDCDLNAGEYVCQVTVDVAGAASQRFAVRARSIFSSANVRITGETPGGVEASFENGQIVVDSTGIANDVVRRLKANISPNSGSEELIFPEFSIQTEAGICKRLLVKDSGNVVDDLNCY